MDPKFKAMEVVTVIGEDNAACTNRCLAVGIGFVTGRSDEYEDGHRDDAVHFNTFGETMAIPEGSLESLGRIADPGEVVTRSRAHRGRGGGSGA